MSMTDPTLPPEPPVAEPPAPEVPGVLEERPDSLVETLKTIVYAVLLALLIRSVALEPFNIPSGSMLPNLLIGDYLFVSKYSYGYSRYSFPFGIAPIEGRWWVEGEPGAPARGTVVVFKLPNGTDDYIKRVIGMPGDHVQMINGRLYINGEKVERDYIETSEMEVDRGNRQVLKHYIEHLPGGVNHEIIERSDEEQYDNTPLYDVPQGHYFMMGDNRDNSADSRVIGFVPEANLLGPARWRFFSVERDFSIFKPWTWFTNVRWSRLLTTVK